MSNKDTPNSLREVAKRQKSKKKEEVQRLREETDELADEIKGNPALVKAIRKLEERMELLEEEVG